MGKRGPTPMHPNLRVLRGDGRPSRNRPPIEATIADTVPEPPVWLDTDAQAQWRAVAGELFRCGLLSTLDTQPLAAWAVAAGRFRAASEALLAVPEAERLLSPLAKVARDESKRMMALGQPFGLSGPASRQRLAGVVKKAPGKFSGLIGGDEPA